jgi:hypothetical protein
LLCSHLLLYFDKGIPARDQQSRNRLHERQRRQKFMEQCSCKYLGIAQSSSVFYFSSGMGYELQAPRNPICSGRHPKYLAIFLGRSVTLQGRGVTVVFVGHDARGPDDVAIQNQNLAACCELCRQF